MRLQCKCLKHQYMIIGINKDELYYYKIINSKSIYFTHLVYDKKNKYLLDMYTKKGFNELFIDIQEERKLKLKQINESR